MNASELAFMTLCEELNFTRAAERCYMTQQGLSAHIKKLENKYGTKLFLRVPSVQLTESGQALREALRHHESLEEDLRRKIAEIDQGISGTVRIGINSARASFLAPGIIEEYCTIYNKVEVHLETSDTSKLRQDLLQGNLDAFIGVNVVPEPSLRIDPLYEEEVLLIVNREAWLDLPQEIRQKYCDAAADKDADFKSKRGLEVQPGEHAAGPRPVSMKDVASLHFVRNAAGSKINQVIDRHLEKQNVVLETQVYISDYNVQFTFCRNRKMAMFCPTSLTYSKGGALNDPDFIVFPIDGLQERLRISLVRDPVRDYPRCAEAFFETVHRVTSSRGLHK